MQYKTSQPLAAALALTAGLFSMQPASAGIISLQIDHAGPVTSIVASSPEQAAGFINGEDIRINFTFDDSVADLRPGTGTSKWQDPNATLTLTGLTSGASLAYLGGLDIEVDDDQEFELEGIPANATALTTPILGGDFDLNTLGTSFFTDPDDLSQIFADLLAAPFPNASINSASTSFWDGSGSVIGMEFGPAPASGTITGGYTGQAPIPAPLALLVPGLIGLALTQARRKKAIG